MQERGGSAGFGDQVVLVSFGWVAVLVLIWRWVCSSVRLRFGGGFQSLLLSSSLLGGGGFGLG